VPGYVRHILWCLRGRKVSTTTTPCIFLDLPLRGESGETNQRRYYIIYAAPPSSTIFRLKYAASIRISGGRQMYLPYQQQYSTLLPPDESKRKMKHHLQRLNTNPTTGSWRVKNPEQDGLEMHNLHFMLRKWTGGAAAGM